MPTGRTPDENQELKAKIEQHLETMLQMVGPNQPNQPFLGEQVTKLADVPPHCPFHVLEVLPAVNGERMWQVRCPDPYDGAPGEAPCSLRQAVAQRQHNDTFPEPGLYEITWADNEHESVGIRPVMIFLSDPVALEAYVQMGGRFPDVALDSLPDDVLAAAAAQTPDDQRDRVVEAMRQVCMLGIDPGLRASTVTLKFTAAVLGIEWQGLSRDELSEAIKLWYAEEAENAAVPLLDRQTRLANFFTGDPQTIVKAVAGFSPGERNEVVFNARRATDIEPLSSTSDIMLYTVAECMGIPWLLLPRERIEGAIVEAWRRDDPEYLAALPNDDEAEVWIGSLMALGFDRQLAMSCYLRHIGVEQIEKVGAIVYSRTWEHGAAKRSVRFRERQQAIAVALCAFLDGYLRVANE